MPAWAAARASAAGLGAARGTWFPEITGDASATRIKTAATQGRTAVQQTLYEPSVSFTWLLLDIGGRTGQISVARNALISANWTHNATLQSVVARAAATYFNYAAAKALLTAQQATVSEAEKNLAAAEERRRVGLATIADVLQARTAFAQTRLDLQTLEGSLLTTRGALAAATGYPATLQFDIDTLAVEAPVSAVSEQVDTLIAAALRDRPDLAAMRADYDVARARIGVARAQRLPSITAGGSAGVNYRSDQSGGRSSYNLAVGLSIPIFNGFIREYNQQRPRHDAEAALARAQGLTQQVIFEVFSSYYALQTSTRAGWHRRRLDGQRHRIRRSRPGPVSGRGRVPARAAERREFARGSAGPSGSRPDWAGRPRSSSSPTMPACSMPGDKSSAPHAPPSPDRHSP